MIYVKWIYLELCKLLVLGRGNMAAGRRRWSTSGMCSLAYIVKLREFASRCHSIYYMNVAFCGRSLKIGVPIVSQRNRKDFG